MLHNVVNDLFLMPRVMKQLAVVQFLSWFALFAMWIYTTAGVTAHHYGTTDTASAAYNDGANWVGVLFAAYNGFAALAALFIPKLAETLGRRKAHLVGLWCGALGLSRSASSTTRSCCWLSMIGVGIAWASILSLPYAMLSQAVPPQKMGIYMGIFNFFIVIPQILAASVLGILVRVLFDGEASTRWCWVARCCSSRGSRPCVSTSPTRSPPRVARLGVSAAWCRRIRARPVSVRSASIQPRRPR